MNHTDDHTHISSHNIRARCVYGLMNHTDDHTHISSHNIRARCVTTAFDAQLEKTMAHFSISRDWFDINYPKGGLGKEIDKMMFFRSKVNDNALFDIKRTAFSRANLGAEYGIYRGQEFRYDDFGNYNYGVAAKYFGFTLDRALLGAGINQISKFNPDFGNPGGYFDHSRDTEMIIRGYYHKW